MDSDKQRGADELDTRERVIAADHVESLEGLTTAVPDDHADYFDQPIVEIAANPMGQFVSMPVVPPSPSQRERLVWLRTLFRSPKARIGAVVVLIFILAALLAP